MRFQTAIKHLTCALLVTLGAQAADTFATREPRYHLHVGDVVSAEYRYTPEFNTSVAIQPDGYASFPGVGSLKLGGLSLDEAQSALTAKASERLNDPEITMNLKEFEKPYVVVGGQVGNPGKVEYHGHLTALRAIELAGGLRPTAKSSQILLIRPVDDANAQTKLIDLKKVIDKHQLQEDVEVHPGDMLVVPKSKLAKVEPYIKLVNAGFYLNPLGF
jgi:polysaccharide export outer membrane protein